MAGERRISPIPKAPPIQRQATPFEPVCAIFRRYLKGQKLKFTPERAMILDGALRREGLFSADMLVEELESINHQVSRATVYRTLTHLHDAGILKQVFFDNKQSYFEVIVSGKANDYLICVETGRVVEFSSDRLRQLRDEICRDHGFQAISHQFHVFGLAPKEKRGAGTSIDCCVGKAAAWQGLPVVGFAFSTGRRRWRA